MAARTIGTVGKESRGTWGMICFTTLCGEKCRIKEESLINSAHVKDRAGNLWRYFGQSSHR
jgi:hypothetical protein